MWISVLVSFCVSLFLIPVIIKLCNRYKLYDPVNARKIHSGNIPRLGGIGIVTAYIAGITVFFITTGNLPFFRILSGAIAAVLIFVFGILDDLFDLPAKLKFAVQFAATAIVIAAGFRFTMIFRWVLPAWFSIPLSFIWILGIINAYNLIDGLDGLCGGLSFLTLVTLGCIFFMFSHVSSGICFITAAAVLGFLVYNRPPAKIFMGDSGSQFLGFMIATAPLFYSGDAQEYSKLPMMLVITAIPVLDTVAAMWRRLREHRSIMSPDRSHLHHKLLNLGYTRTQALCLLLILQVLLCIIVCLAVYLKKSKGVILLIVGYVFMIFFFSVIHYTNRAVNRKDLYKKE
jgi:UDP-GlcNAc:undecaprenyl-phosphate/decaprenyl-phosphate GlcNAc-1-phosphate transferase